jgi:hypothetical protein
MMTFAIFLVGERPCSQDCYYVYCHKGVGNWRVAAASSTRTHAKRWLHLLSDGIGLSVYLTV